MPHGMPWEAQGEASRRPSGASGCKKTPRPPNTGQHGGHDAEGRARAPGPAGAGTRLAPSPDSDVPWDTCQLPQSQVPQLESGNNSLCLTGSQWKFKTKGTEGRAPAGCCYTRVCWGRAWAWCACTERGAMRTRMGENMSEQGEISRQRRWGAPPSPPSPPKGWCSSRAQRGNAATNGSPAERQGVALV